MRGALALWLARLYGRFVPFPQRKWRICLFLLSLGGVHPWKNREAWQALTDGREPEVVRLSRGFRMSCDWQDTAHLPITLVHDHQPYETDVLEKLIRPGDTVVDGGANIGFYTVLFALRAGPSGRVYAFEPVSSVAGKVRENLALNADLPLAEVTFRQAGLGDAARTMPIYLRPSVSGTGIDSQHSSIVAGLNTAAEDAITETIEVRRLDDEGISGRLDVVKCDIEGAEKAFLEGGRGTLTREKPLLVLEWTPSKDTYSVAEMLETLASLGDYEVYRMRRGRLLPSTQADLETFSGDVVCATPAHRAERLRGMV